MKKINFTNENHGEKYILSVYSDTQVNVVIPYIERDMPYRIISRFSSYKDLFAILAANQILRRAGVDYIELFCPYILGGRSDQSFKPNQSFDLEIVADILNTCKFAKVTVLNPHSVATTALIHNCEALDVLSWLELSMLPREAVLISPDAGAYKKMVKIAETLNKPLIAANKVRLDDGSPAINFDGDVTGRNCVIMDDICDGGRTFIALGKALKDKGAATVTLVVDHGIFSYGTKLDNIDMIYTTNSYRDNFTISELGKHFKVVNIFS